MTLEESIKELRRAQKEFIDEIEARLRGNKIASKLIAIIEKLID